MPSLSQIEYPVFRLKSDIVTEDGITYATSTGKILDNKNLAGITLCERRLKYGSEELAHTGQMLFNIGSLMQFKKGERFIDSYGVIFKLAKYNVYPLTCHRIRSIENTGDMYTSYLRLEGTRIPVKYKGIFTPKVGNYARVIKYSGGYMFYDEVFEQMKKTTRKI